MTCHVARRQGLNRNRSGSRQNTRRRRPVGNWREAGFRSPPVPQARGLNIRNVISHSSRARQPRPRCQPGGFLPRARRGLGGGRGEGVCCRSLSLACRWLSLLPACSPRLPPSVRGICVLIASSYEDISQIGLGHTHRVLLLRSQPFTGSNIVTFCICGIRG